MMKNTIAASRGAALMSVLVMMVVLATLASGVVARSILTEKTTRAYQEYARALRAAESSVHAAESLLGNASDISDVSNVLIVAAENEDENLSVLIAGCSSQWWRGESASCERVVGQPVGVGEIGVESHEPSGFDRSAYAIEYIGAEEAALNRGESYGNQPAMHYFRIISRGTGRLVNDSDEAVTVVFLESIYSVHW